jgi:hypothetical protein
MAGCYEHGHEHSGSGKREEFFDRSAKLPINLVKTLARFLAL